MIDCFHSESTREENRNRTPSIVWMSLAHLSASIRDDLLSMDRDHS